MEPNFSGYVEDGYVLVATCPECGNDIDFWRPEDGVPPQHGLQKLIECPCGYSIEATILPLSGMN